MKPSLDSGKVRATSQSPSILINPSFLFHPHLTSPVKGEGRSEGDKDTAWSISWQERLA